MDKPSKIRMILEGVKENGWMADKDVDRMLKLVEATETSKKFAHQHAVSIDAKGNGKTTSVIGAKTTEPHVHKIVKGKVQFDPADTHNHRID